jgi:hypothetical protein
MALSRGISAAARHDRLRPGHCPESDRGTGRACAMLTNSTIIFKAVTNGRMVQTPETAISAKLQQNINSGNWINWQQKSCSK